MMLTPPLGAAAGFVIGALLGYLFFHEPGDALLGSVLAAGVLAISFAVVGYLLVRGRPLRRPD